MPLRLEGSTGTGRRRESAEVGGLAADGYLGQFWVRPSVWHARNKRENGEFDLVEVLWFDGMDRSR